MAIVGMLLPLAAHAQGMTPDDFIRQAAEDNIADVEAGRMAQSTQTVPVSIRQLGRQITGEAMRAHDKLSKIASTHAVPLANQITPADRQALDRLSKLQGQAFAREYLRYVMNDLEQDRALFQVATGLEDSSVATYARDALPGLDSDLQVARALYDAQVAGVPQ